MVSYLKLELGGSLLKLVWAWHSSAPACLTLMSLEPKFLDPIFVRTQLFLEPKYFWIQKCFTQQFINTNFFGLGPKIFYWPHFFRPNFFLDKALFTLSILDPNFFNQIFRIQNCFGLNISSEHKILDLNFFGPTISWTPNFCGPTPS